MKKSRGGQEKSEAREPTFAEFQAKVPPSAIYAADAHMRAAAASTGRVWQLLPTTYTLHLRQCFFHYNFRWHPM